MILENDRLERYDLSSLRYCYCGGDVLPLEVFNRWEARFGIPIYQVYGSTEAGHVTYSRINRKPKPGSIGMPLKSRECIVVDPETLYPVPRGESGELLVTSPYTIKQYWNNIPGVCVRSGSGFAGSSHGDRGMRRGGAGSEGGGANQGHCRTEGGCEGCGWR